MTCVLVYYIEIPIIRPKLGNWLDKMISDASKLALVGVAAVFGILAGFKVSNNMESTLNSNLHIEAINTEQRLLREEEAANKLNSNSASSQVDVGMEPPKWQLTISQASMLFPLPHGPSLHVIFATPVILTRSCTSTGQTYPLYSHQKRLQDTGLGREQRDQVCRDQFALTEPVYCLHPLNPLIA